MDKELLKKHHFWFLLIPIFILAAVVWIGLWTSVADATSQQLGKINSHSKELDTASSTAKSQHLREGLDKQKQELLDRRTKMWEEAWKAQESIFTWPEEYGKDREMLEKLPFGSPIDDRDLRSHIRTEKYYLAEYLKMVKEAQPLQFNGGWTSVLRHIDGWEQKLIPEPEDIWLALEDFWVQREMIRMLNEVNKKAAVFTEVGKSEDPLSRKFANRFWEIDLKVTSDVKGDRYLEATLKNITNRVQVFGIKNVMELKVWLDKGDEFPFVYRIEGVFLEAGKDMKVKRLMEHRLTKPANDLARVEQVFDARTVPIKRIDKLVLGYQSSRTNSYALKMAPFSQKIVDELAKAADTSASTGTGTGTGSVGTGFGSSPMGGGLVGGLSTGTGGDPSGGTAATDRSGAGLDRKRYIDVTAQVRRMPVAMVVILDQNFLPDVLESMTNSKLRCQNTQYHWKRFKGASGFYSSSTGESGGGAPSGFTPMGGSSPPMGGSSPPMGGFTPPPMGGSFIPMGSGTGTLANNTNRDPLSASMIELSVYGIASLYEKFNAAPVEATTPMTPVDPLLPK